MKQTIYKIYTKLNTPIVTAAEAFHEQNTNGKIRFNIYMKVFCIAQYFHRCIWHQRQNWDSFY